MITRKHTIILLIQLTLFTICPAQREKIDSLSRLSFPINDTSQINWLNELGNAYSLYSDDSATLFALLALQKAKDLRFAKGIAVANINLAWINWLRSDDFPGMELLCKNAISLLDDSPHQKEFSHSWFLLALSYWAQAKFSLSVEAFKRSSEIYATIGDELNQGIMYSYIAWVEEGRGQYARSLNYSVKWLEVANRHNDYRYSDVWAALYKNIGDYETSLHYYRQSADVAFNSPRKDDQAFLTQAIGEIFFLKQNYDSARYYYAKAESYLPNKPKLYSPLGELYLALKQYDSAFFYLNSALRQSKTAGFTTNEMWILLRLSGAYFETGKTELAGQAATKLLSLAMQSGARQYIRDAHYYLYQLYANAGKENRAYRHLRHYLKYKDSLDKDLSAQQLASYKIQAEKEKDQARINLLNKEKELQRQRMSRQKIYLITGLSIVVLASLVLFRNVTLRRKNERLRFEHKLEIQSLEIENTRIEFKNQATELEMQALRAQMNPHFIFNSLNSINRFILQNNKAQGSEYLTKFSKLVRMILQNSQASLITLESELDALKLYLDLEALRFEQHFTYKISVPKDLDIEILKVPPLIIQPYAENAIWHGLMHKEEKGHLEIEISQNENHLLFKITDDGVGRKKAAELKSKSTSAHKSMGLKITADRIGMLQRLNENESPITINDLVHADGSTAGTEVSIKLPVIYS
jgi:tetratricopeptide (TPR) repeat protein